MRKNAALIIALALPVAALLSLTAYKAWIFTRGVEVVLPITGYDPRDLLAGHYLTYRVDYGVEDPCRDYSSQTACVCLSDEGNEFRSRCDATGRCRRFIAGSCREGRFMAGIERYYIPESKARELDAKVRRGGAKIRVAVDPSGNAVVKDLIVPQE